MPVQSSVSVRWRVERFACDASDLVRVRADEDVTLALLANAGECGFSVFWPTASRLLLDGFEQAWEKATGTVSDRLRAAFEAACADFRREASGLEHLHPEDTIVPGEFAYGTLFALAMTDHRAEAAWVGPARAVLVRDGLAVGHTLPHTSEGEALARGERPPWLDGQFLRRLCRAIRTDTHSDASTTRFELKPGDTLLLIEGGHKNKASITPDAFARLVSAASDLEAAASRVATVEYDYGTPALTAVAALHLPAGAATVDATS